MNNNDVDKMREAFRDMIMNEEAIIHRRLTWLISIQIPMITGVLGGNYYATLQGSVVISSFLAWFALAGTVSGLLILSALMSSAKAMSDINVSWHKVKPKEYYGPDIFGMVPDFNVSMGVFPYLSSENMLAFMFVVWWGIPLWYFNSPYQVFMRTIHVLVVLAIILFWVYIYFSRRDRKN